MGGGHGRQGSPLNAQAAWRSTWMSVLAWWGLESSGEHPGAGSSSPPKPCPFCAPFTQICATESLDPAPCPPLLPSTRLFQAFVSALSRKLLLPRLPAASRLLQRPGRLVLSPVFPHRQLWTLVLPSSRDTSLWAGDTTSAAPNPFLSPWTPPLRLHPWEPPSPPRCRPAPNPSAVHLSHPRDSTPPPPGCLTPSQI